MILQLKNISKRKQYLHLFHYVNSGSLWGKYHKIYFIKYPKICEPELCEPKLSEFDEPLRW